MKKQVFKHPLFKALAAVLLIISLLLSNTGYVVYAMDPDENSAEADMPDEAGELNMPQETGNTSPKADDAQTTAANELRLVYGNPDIPDEDAFVLLIMGDGFKTDEQDKFFTESVNTANYVMATSPYDEFQNTIKIYALSVISNESGAKGDKALTYEEAMADTRDTYFGSSYYSGGMQRLLSLGSDGSKKATALKDQYLPQADFNVIMVNSETYGGSGGSICVASLNNESLEMMLHELGHTIANLADEYFAGASYAREYANMTAESDAAKVKWKRFIGKNGVGVYEYDNGGNGWYRPHENCKMRFLGQRYAFCEVCKEELRRAFSKHSNETQMFFQTYADPLKESDTPIDMKQYFILRKASNETVGSDQSVADKLTLTFSDENGNNPTTVTPTQRGTYKITASFAGDSTYDPCTLTATYTLDYPDLVSLKVDTKVYDGKPAELKYTVDYDKEYTIGAHYTGQIPYSTTPEKTYTYDSDTPPTIPGSYTVTVTAYDKLTSDIISKASVDYSIKFKTTVLADNNSNGYPGAQSYYNNQNIVFIGEGFTADEQDKFDAIAKKYFEYFQNTEPYKEANLYFNYHTVLAVSNESGISRPNAEKDTYFGLSLDSQNKLKPTELSTGAAMYLGNNEITSYYKGAIVIVNDDSITGGARVDNKRVTLYAGANEDGMKYAAREFLNYYAGSPEGTDWMKDDASKEAMRNTLLKKIYYIWYGTSYSPILSRAYNETFTEDGTAVDLAPYFHTYVNGVEPEGITYTMTYYKNNNGVLGQQLDSAPSAPGSYFAKADLVPDQGKSTKTVTIDGNSYTLPLARGITPYEIKAKDSDPGNPGTPGEPGNPGTPGTPEKPSNPGGNPGTANRPISPSNTGSPGTGDNTDPAIWGGIMSAALLAAIAAVWRRRSR